VERCEDFEWRGGGGAMAGHRGFWRFSRLLKKVFFFRKNNEVYKNKCFLLAFFNILKSLLCILFTISNAMQMRY